MTSNGAGYNYTAWPGIHHVYVLPGTQFQVRYCFNTDDDRKLWVNQVDRIKRDAFSILEKSIELMITDCRSWLRLVDDFREHWGEGYCPVDVKATYNKINATIRGCEDVTATTA
jgi:hypothetical protein